MRGTADRRAFLQAAGAVSAVGLAGCIDSLDSLAGDGEYPSQSLTNVVPYDEGGGSDVIVRQIMPIVSDELGEDIQIDNMPGASGLRGAGHVMNAEPDGYTFLKINVQLASITAMINPPDFEFSDLKGLCVVGGSPLAVIANPDLELEGLQDAIDRYENGELDNIGGLGAMFLVQAVILRDQYGLDWNSYIQYDGSGPVVQAVASGEVPLGIVSDAAAEGAIESGDVEGAVVLHSSGSIAMPETDTITDQGFDDMDFVGEATRCTWVPPETPEDRIETLSEAIRTGIEAEETQEWAEESGNRLEWEPADQADAYMEEVWEEVPERIDIDELREEAE